MNQVTARHLAVVLAAAFVLAGCTSGTNDQPSQETTTTTTETETETGPSPNPACEDVADKGRALLTEVGRFATRDATVGDVQAAAGELSDAFDEAKATLGPDTRAQLDQVGQALQRVQDALATQPVDTAALRRATSDLVAAASDAATLCTPGSAGETTTP
jgi:ABC-type sugar transport system substrate-binding protein